MINKNEPSNVVSLPERARCSSSETNLKKRELFAEWLQLGTVMLLLDARKEGVKVPDEFKSEGDLRLNFCYQFHIPDFNFNEVGVWATLSFSSYDQFCMVPWESVYGIQSLPGDEVALWHNDTPADYCHDEIIGYGTAVEKVELPTEALVKKQAEENNDVINNVISVDFTNKSSVLVS